MNKKLIRKMLTASGGPLRIKFTPEQIALFESLATRVPGINNSGGNKYREEGVLALQHLEQEAKRKEEEIKSRMEMRPTLKRKATIAEKLQGKKDEYELGPLVVGMSGRDPLLGTLFDLYVGGKGIEAAGKLGLWGAAKYAPGTLLGNWGRGYFIGNEMKLVNPLEQTARLGITLKAMTPKVPDESSTSLKFFERPTFSNAQELAGATKWERNFKPKWHVANYPGYLLKGLMKGSLLEKLLSKNGTININLLNAHFNKASQIEKDVASKVLNEQFAGLKTIDYNLFKKAVLDELITYSTKPQMRYSTYGMNRLGFNVIKESDGAGGIVEYLPGIRTNTFTFESPKLSVGSNKHYDTTTLGHSRTYTTPEEPNILHVMESLSDWGQSHVKMMPSVLAHQIAIEKAIKSGNTNAFHSFTNRFGSLLADKLTKYERMALENINKEIESGLPSGFLTIEDLWSKKYEILKKAGNRSNIGVLGQHLHNNYLQRQLQENLRYAAENGLTKMRYPTSETAAKIEGYTTKLQWYSPTGEKLDMRKLEFNPETGDFEYPEGSIMKNEYPIEHQTILKKYTDFPKLFLKLFKDLKVITVTDAKGNTWYEVDVPKGYLNREWLFKKGGKMNILEFLKNGSGIHIKKKNRGKFTSYCGGKVTYECILKGKNSSNPAIRKRATFAANARKWKHKEGGIIKAEFGLKLSNTVNKIGDFFNSNTGKGLLNLGMQAFGAIKGSVDANNYSNSFDAETNSLLKAMDASQRKNNYKLASQIASEIIKLKQLENPDIHYGPIDKLLLENQIANSLYDDSEIVKYQMLRALEKLKLMLAIQGSSSGILDTVGGILDNFIGNKKDTSTNTSSNNSTFGNYVKTLFKNYGTFNSDGSMNMGQLGTWDINNGYKQKKIGTFMNNYT